MDDYFSNSGKRLFIRFSDLAKGALGKRFKGEKLNRRHILIISILILSMGLFFSVLIQKNAYAKQKIFDRKEVPPEAIDPLNRIEKGFVKKINLQTFADFNSEKEKSALETEEGFENKEKKEKSERERKIKEMVKGHPIEEMAGIISERDEKTAAFLVAIARKESSWGLHAPSKNGRDCFNYWGYKGNYNLVKGYSCFDSKEQAVEVVGGKIKSLIDRKIDTPERLVVWKCGSSCAGHDPKGVQKWIADVRGVFSKLAS